MSNTLKTTNPSSRQELAQELLDTLIATQTELDRKETMKAFMSKTPQNFVGESFMLNGLKNLKELLAQ